MNSSSKQRIIGAFVLFALALIFLPAVFDFSGEQTIDTTPQIPPRPDIEPVEIEPPVRPTNIDPPKSFDEAFQPPVEDVKEESVELEPEPPKLNKEGLPESWVIQVASFSEKEKAELLVAQLQQDGYKSYLQPVTVGGQLLHRVFVGPKILKQRALEEKKQIDKKYQLETLVLKFSH